MSISVLHYILIFCVTVTNGFYLTKQEVKKPYSFSYDVKDLQKGTDFHRAEKSNGNIVLGSYSVQLPDGRTQTVTYEADHNKGFVADVSYSGNALYPPPKSAHPFTVKPEYLLVKESSTAHAVYNSLVPRKVKDTSSIRVVPGVIFNKKLSNKKKQPKSKNTIKTQTVIKLKPIYHEFFDSEDILRNNKQYLEKLQELIMQTPKRPLQSPVKLRNTENTDSTRNNDFSKTLKEDQGTNQQASAAEDKSKNLESLHQRQRTNNVPNSDNNKGIHSSYQSVNPTTTFAAAALRDEPNISPKNEFTDSSDVQTTPSEQELIPDSIVEEIGRSLVTDTNVQDSKLEPYSDYLTDDPYSILQEPETS